MFCNHCLRMAAARRQLPLIKQLSTSAWLRTSEQILSTPVTLPGESSSRTRAAPRSICPEGTVLQGLNYQKNGHDPVAMKDEDYPEWLWSCLDVVKVAEAGIEESADEFSKSKKQRRIAAKRQKAQEAKLLAEGNLEALAPKVPVQNQSINLPGKANGSVEDNILAFEKREELRKAMRQERKAKIKESNFLKAM